MHGLELYFKFSAQQMMISTPFKTSRKTSITAVKLFQHLPFLMEESGHECKPALQDDGFGTEMGVPNVHAYVCSTDITE